MLLSRRSTVLIGRLQFAAFPGATTTILQPVISARAPYRLIPTRMVEGHQCHRVGHAHRKALLGKAFKAISPNARFAEGAAAIHNRPLQRIEVHGKNLFYFFGEGADTTVMRVHFGMSGHFRVVSLPGPEPKPTTRLVLTHEEEGLAAHLSAMFVQHGGLEFYEEEAAKLGPDPLREDADKEAVWARFAASRKPAGLLLMDQTCIAGVGNIYRAEILFKAGVHPEQPGNTVPREAFEEIWRHSVLLLQRGFKSGSILTVDPEEAAVLGPPWTRRYVYNQKQCGRCKSGVRTWDMAARTVYACETCQPLRPGAEITPARAKALAASRPTQVFLSHCAPDGSDSLVPEKLTLAQLKAQLQARALPTAGRKPDLLQRLQAALAAAGTTPATSDSSPAPASKPAPGTKVASNSKAVAPTSTAADSSSAASEMPESDAGVVEAGKQSMSKLTVAELKALLKALGLSTGGKKADLQQRLAAVQPPGGEAAGKAPVAEAAEQKSARAGSRKQRAARVEPGTKHMGAIATAEAAALEKMRAKEGRNVEHVALEDDATLELAQKAGSKPHDKSRKRRKAAPADPDHAGGPSIPPTPDALETVSRKRKGMKKEGLLTLKSAS